MVIGHRQVLQLNIKLAAFPHHSGAVSVRNDGRGMRALCHNNALTDFDVVIEDEFDGIVFNGCFRTQIGGKFQLHLSSLANQAAPRGAAHSSRRIRTRGLVRRGGSAVKRLDRTRWIVSPYGKHRFHYRRVDSRVL